MGDVFFFPYLFMFFGLAFYGFLLWLAWTLVQAIRGIERELGLIRRELGDLRPQPDRR